MSLHLVQLIWYILGILTAVVGMGVYLFWRTWKARRHLRRSYRDVPAPLYLGKHPGHQRTDMSSHEH